MDTPEERLRILPTRGILMELVQSWSESMDESKIEQLIKDAGKGDTGMKMLLYKFFFFNYTFQVVGPDITEHIITAEAPHSLKE